MAYDAVVIGAGPNGLAAAIVLAQAGCSTLLLEAAETIGGGCRTAEITLAGFRHDVCSTAHPLGRGSPFFRRLPLARYGLRWIHPPAALAHPLDDGEVVLLRRGVEETASGLGVDARTYRKQVDAFNRLWPRLESRLLGHPFRWRLDPGADLKLASLARPASWEARRFRSQAARSLLAGAAAHTVMPLDKPFTGGVGWLLLVAAHRYGWPFVEGGSQALADALAACFLEAGGEIETRRRVTDLADLPPARVVLADVVPSALEAILGREERHGRKTRGRRGFRHGPGVFKLDWALSEPVPWKDARMATAGVLHLGGDFDQIAATERMVWAGEIPERPFIVAAQPSLFDRSRSPAGMHTLWAYTHVPSASAVDMRAMVEQEIERHAPGFGDTVVACHTISASQWEDYNPNYVGGDIGGGVLGVRRLLRGPYPGWSPYATDTDGVYLCSSSTPPGGGVHGMCGYHAAQVALRKINAG
ncbi:MAG: NAD(P)/FAD-dependent oxidoreductase [bacterium]|nr:NAD(P)/FAD-dependent oxidoreductase [Acidimicrobiia bacterium]MCY4649278.1 NAD(P)/FAD-dependent oxidoreductase [bacterium]